MQEEELTKFQQQLLLKMELYKLYPIAFLKIDPGLDVVDSTIRILEKLGFFKVYRKFRDGKEIEIMACEKIKEPILEKIDTTLQPPSVGMISYSELESK